jgi:butyrate kinase
MQNKRVLVINPGSTSTKIAVFEGNHAVFIKSIRHSLDELSRFEKVIDQYMFRKDHILTELEKEHIDSHTLHLVMGRGGLIKPIPSGVYEITPQMIEDLKANLNGEHASNLGGLIAWDIARHLPHAKAYISDPVVVDEMQPLARITGHPLFERKSIFHALNQKAMGRKYARSLHTQYDALNLVIAHMGGGISVGAHRQGKVIDVNQALDGEGPFSPERSGTLPAGELVELCFSGKHTQEEIRKMINGQGGWVAYLGTNNASEVERRAKSGDLQARLFQQALSYQVAKEIGSMSTVLKGKVDAIILTGGLAHSDTIVKEIIEKVEYITRVIVYPGEDEMTALATNGFMVLTGEIEVFKYE